MAGRENVGKKGVVRDKNVHKQVIEMVMEFAKSIGFDILNLDFSPVKGPEGKFLTGSNTFVRDIKDTSIDAKAITSSISSFVT